MGVGEQQDERYQAVQVAVVVPRSFVQQECVPVSGHKDQARRFELIS